MWDEEAGEVPSGMLCTMLAMMNDPKNAASLAAGSLQGWVLAGMLAGVAVGR